MGHFLLMLVWAAWMSPGLVTLLKKNEQIPSNTNTVFQTYKYYILIMLGINNLFHSR